MNAGLQRAAALPDKKLMLLIVLLSALAFVIFRQLSSSGLQGEAKGGSAEKKQMKESKDPQLVEARLLAGMPVIQSEKRNIFSFAQAPAPPEPAEQVNEAQQEEPPAVCGNQMCEEGEDFENCPSDCPPPPPPPPPPINLRYIGYMTEAGGSVAFLTDGKDVYVGRVNDIIANKYRVLKITDELVELGYLNMNQSSTIRFQGNQGG